MEKAFILGNYLFSPRIALERELKANNVDKEEIGMYEAQVKAQL